MQNLISKKEIVTQFINLPQRVDLATGDLFKEKTQFKIHSSITPKKGLTREQAIVEANKDRLQDATYLHHGIDCKQLLVMVD